jgi:uridine kinase
MRQKKIKITIEGAAADGKTTVAKVIEEALRNHHFEVIQNDEDLTSGEPELWQNKVELVLSKINKIQNIVLINTIRTRTAPF